MADRIYDAASDYITQTWKRFAGTVGEIPKDLASIGESGLARHHIIVYALMDAEGLGGDLLQELTANGLFSMGAAGGQLTPIGFPSPSWGGAGVGGHESNSRRSEPGDPHP